MSFIENFESNGVKFILRYIDYARSSFSTGDAVPSKGYAFIGVVSFSFEEIYISESLSLSGDMHF